MVFGSDSLETLGKEPMCSSSPKAICYRIFLLTFVLFTLRKAICCTQSINLNAYLTQKRPPSWHIKLIIIPPQPDLTHYNLPVPDLKRGFFLPRLKWEEILFPKAMASDPQLLLFSHWVLCQDLTIRIGWLEWFEIRFGFSQITFPSHHWEWKGYHLSFISRQEAVGREEKPELIIGHCFLLW